MGPMPTRGVDGGSPATAMPDGSGTASRALPVAICSAGTTLIACLVGKAAKVLLLSSTLPVGEKASMLAFFGEDLACCVVALAAIWVTMICLGSVMRIIAASLALLLSLLSIIVIVADVFYFQHMGATLELQTLQLALGAHAGALLMTVFTQFPLTIPLLIAVIFAYVTILLRFSRHCHSMLSGVIAMCCAAGAQRPLARRNVLAGLALFISTSLVVSVILGTPTLTRDTARPISRPFIHGTKRQAIMVRLRANILLQLGREAMQQGLASLHLTAPGARIALPVVQPIPLEQTAEERAEERAHRPDGAEAAPPPDVVLVLLEGVGYDALPTHTRLQPGGVLQSGALEELRQRGLLVHAPNTYTSIPNTLKATYAALCGVLPEPPLTSSYLREYEPASGLLEGCLPRVLNRTMGGGASPQGKGAGYESTFLTSSSVLDNVHGQMGFDRVHGYAAADSSWRQRTAAVGTKTTFEHGAFERVNWLGYDDFILLQPAVDALDAARGRGQSAFVTLFTVGTHSRYSVPSHVKCLPDGTITSKKPRRLWWRRSKRARKERTAASDFQHTLTGNQTLKWLQSGDAARKYSCTVRYTEAFLEALVKRLIARDPGLERTLLVVAGDHGEAFGEHGQYSHGTSTHPEETRVPLLLGGGPVQRAVRTGELVLSSGIAQGVGVDADAASDSHDDADAASYSYGGADAASSSSALGGVHRLEDLAPTIVELLGVGGRERGAPAKPSAEEAARATMLARLAQLGLAGRSMLWASRHPLLASGRSVLLHTMFGSRKLGTVRMVCGALHTTSYTYSGCGDCEVLEAQRTADSGAATALASDAPAYTSDVRYALQLLAAATSLHHHMREDGVQGHRSWATTAANVSATARLARANALLQAWLHPFADSAFEDGSHLSVPPLKHETTTCACRQLAGKPFLDATFPTTSPACPGAPSTPRSSNTGGVSKRHTLQTTAERVVVTLGTLPSRNCTTAVASLVNQSRPPDAIYVAAPKRSVWAGNAKAKLPRGLRAAAGSRLRILQPDHDRGPAEKYLGTLENEVRPQTVVIVADDDWIYPFDFVATLLDALHSLEAASGAAVAVGGSGMRLPNNLSRFVVEQPEPRAPCERHLAPPQANVGVFRSSLPTGCRLRVNVLQGFGGIAFRRKAVDLPMLTSLVRAAPHFLRYSADDLILASHFHLRKVPRWLVSSPIPELLPGEASKDALHGWLKCETNRSRGLPRMLTHYQLSLVWLHFRMRAWPKLDVRALKGTGRGCLSTSLSPLSTLGTLGPAFLPPVPGGGRRTRKIW